MAMAEAWLRGIGKYPPYPSRLPVPPLVRRLRLRTSGGIGNLSGCGGYFPIPPRQASANVPLYTIENLAQPLYHLHFLKEFPNMSFICTKAEQDSVTGVPR